MTLNSYEVRVATRLVKAEEFATPHNFCKHNSYYVLRYTDVPFKRWKINSRYARTLNISINLLKVPSCINPLNAELNPICYLLALLGAHHFLHVSRIRVKLLTFRRLMSYIYVYMEHPFLMFLDHTQRRSTVGRTPLDE